MTKSEDIPPDGEPNEGTELVPSSSGIGQFFSDPKFAKYGRFIFAALGVIPWIGGLLGATAALHAENEQGQANEAVRRWLEEHDGKLRELQTTLGMIVSRLEEIGGTEVDERLQDERYLEIVRQGFRTWDSANAKEKREYVRRTLTNAGSTRYCSDDVVRLFLQWIDHYDEIHFQVMRAVYREPGSTRADVWEKIHGEQVRDDSAEADLFRLLIRDLSTGGVIRQERETDYAGRFKKKPAAKGSRSGSTMESAFEDSKPYVLTALGEQFVHYALDEAAYRVGQGA
jgi:hypothetical protein